MVDLTKDAVKLLMKTVVPVDSHNRPTIFCATADAFQGETFDFVVLALPPSAAVWSDWLCDPNRLLTIISRYRWQLAMPWVHETSNSSRSHTLSKSVRAVLDLQKTRSHTWTMRVLLT